MSIKKPAQKAAIQSGVLLSGSTKGIAKVENRQKISKQMPNKTHHFIILFFNSAANINDIAIPNNIGKPKSTVPNSIASTSLGSKNKNKIKKIEPKPLNKTWNILIFLF